MRERPDASPSHRLLGTVVSVSLSPERGIPKFPQSNVHIGHFGVEGDCHAGPKHTNLRTGEEKDNRRHVTIVAQEVLEEMNEALDIQLRPGDLAENILATGLGDLSNVATGEKLLLGEGILLEVTGQNKPCNNLLRYHQRLAKNIYGKRGLIARVLKTGDLRPGDSIELIREEVLPPQIPHPNL